MTTDSSGDGIFASAAARRRAIVHTAVLAALLLILTVSIVHLVPQVTDQSWIRAAVVGFGPFAPFAFVVLQTVQVVLAPIPGQMLASAGGYLFGPLRGTAYSMVGVLAGSSIVFLVARTHGRPYVEAALTDEAVGRWDGIIDSAGVPGLFALFVLPTFPDDLLCAVAGCSSIRFRTFVALVLVGRTPSFLAVAYVGGRLSTDDIESAAVVAGLLALLTLLVYVGRHRLLETGPTTGSKHLSQQRGT